MTIVGASNRTRVLHWLVLGTFVALLIVAAVSQPVQRALLGAVEWCAASGALGIAVYGLLYTASTLLVLPAAILTAAAGWAWGLWGGTAVVLGVSLVADWIPFAIARRLGRERVAAAAEHRRMLLALDTAFRSHGFALVALLRLSPVAPYNVTNYLLGLTPVSTFTYLSASTLGCIPGVLFIVHLGTLVPRSAQLGEVSLLGDPLHLVVAIGLSMIAMAGVIIIARRALTRIADLS